MRMVRRKGDTNVKDPFITWTAYQLPTIFTECNVENCGRLSMSNCTDTLTGYGQPIRLSTKVMGPFYSYQGFCFNDTDWYGRTLTQNLLAHQSRRFTISVAGFIIWNRQRTVNRISKPCTLRIPTDEASHRAGETS